MNIKNLISEFMQELAKGGIEIYNEASLQLELVLFLRTEMSDLCIQVERNISDFDISKGISPKERMDICIFSKDRSQLLCAIELKVPKNKAHPKVMFSFCKDITFMEHVKKNGFKQAFTLFLTDDNKFYEGGCPHKLYSYFRSTEILTGCIPNTSKTNKIRSVDINGSYVIEWQTIKDSLKYALVEIE